MCRLYAQFFWSTIGSKHMGKCSTSWLQILALTLHVFLNSLGTETVQRLIANKNLLGMHKTKPFQSLSVTYANINVHCDCHMYES